MRSFIFSEELRAWGRQLIHFFRVERSWVPVLCIGLALAASFVHSTPLRLLITGVAIILFLVAAVDVALCFMEEDRGPSNPLKPSPRVPVTLFQVLLAIVQCAIYSIAMFELLGSLISILGRPTLWAGILAWLLIPLISGFIAWRNVRLWAHEGAEYEEMLNERKNEEREKERLRKMRLPESYWAGPPR